MGGWIKENRYEPPYEGAKNMLLVVLILASLVFHYGAELETIKKE